MSEIEDACVECEEAVEQILILPSGKEVPCVPQMESVSNIIIIGGREEVIAATVNVRKSHFITADMTTLTVDSELILADNDTPRPRTGKKPQFRGKTYRFLTVEQDPSGAYFRVKMGSAK